MCTPPPFQAGGKGAEEAEGVGGVRLGACLGAAGVSRGPFGYQKLGYTPAPLPLGDKTRIG